MKEDYFKDVWDTLKPALLRIVDRAKLVNPSISVSLGQYSNESFPFRGYLVISRNEHQTMEDLVIMVDAHHGGSGYEWSCDISEEETTNLIAAESKIYEHSIPVADWLPCALASTLALIERSEGRMIATMSSWPLRR